MALGQHYFSGARTKRQYILPMAVHAESILFYYYIQLILLNLTGAYILYVMKSFNQKTALRKHVQHLYFFNFEYFSCVSIY